MILVSAVSFLNPSMAAKTHSDPTGEAPKAGMGPGYWSSGVKQFFGTSYEAYDSNNQYSDKSPTAPISHVWFTGAQGVLTEVYWPTVDVAQVRDHQFLVTDGKSLFFEERNNSTTEVEWLEPGVPAFRVTNKDPQGRFEIERTVFSDPDRDVVLQHIKITRHIDGLQFYLLHNPSVANTPLGDNAQAELSASPGQGLYAWQDSHAQAVLLSVNLKQVSAGFEGSPNDGYADVKAHLGMASHYEFAHDGNVVLTAWVDIPATQGVSEFDIALGFGHTVQSAHDIAAASLAAGPSALLDKYTSQWLQYQQSVRDLSSQSTDKGELFRDSVAIMKSMEDKTYAGAFVASPVVPWGLNQIDWSAGFYKITNGRREMMSGYHIIWPRDLYQMATSFTAIDDYKSAIASLNYLKTIQYDTTEGNWTFGSHNRNKDGSFPQNCWVDGTNHWGSVQLDEVSMPIVLAYRLWKAQEIKSSDYWNMVSRAADFLSDFGPWTPEERWEEIFGYSPSTIAAEIAALKAAALFADDAKDATRAARYRSLATAWSASLETWLFTTTGKYANGKFYLRIKGANQYDQKIDPNDDSTFSMANHGGTWQEKDVTDGGFLELVRFGIRSALSTEIQETVAAYDATIRVDLPNIGPGFRRYYGDRYNYDETTNLQTMGMPWPILSGERGHFELAAAVERKLGRDVLDATIRPFVTELEKFSTPSHMIPEQVWDSGDKIGQPTGAATPLGWAHAEYIKLLRSRQDKKPFDLATIQPTTRR